MNFELHTDRLFLRPVRDEDAKPAFEILHAHPDITRFMTFDPPERLEDTLEYFQDSQKNCLEKRVVWGIFLRDRFIGLVSLDAFTKNLGAWRMDRAEIGYWLDPEFHGQGIMTEASQAVMQFGFEKLDLHKIIVGHVSDNTASQKVIEKLGFRLVGERKDHFFRFGKWWDHKNYELTINEWER